MILVKCDGCGIVESARKSWDITPINWANIKAPTDRRDEDGDPIKCRACICPECLMKIKDLLGLKLRFEE